MAKRYRVYHLETDEFAAGPFETESAATKCKKALERWTPEMFVVK